MDYTLAKELKDAGFPQKTEKQFAVFGEHFTIETVEATRLRHEETKPDDTIACPTLEELIEACGRAFHQLEYHRDDSCWSVSYWFDFTNGKDLKLKVGATPTEAVARLWLVLNPLPEQQKEI